MAGRSIATKLTRAMLLCCVALSGCDQYATIGVVALELDGGRRPPDASSMNSGDSGLLEPSDAAISADAAMDAATDAGEACVRPDVAVCDPVANTGCPPELGMQCAIDLVNPLSGYCIFNSPDMGAACLNSVVTDSCAAGSACVDGQCQELCFCDADCVTGQCCVTPIVDTGFSACGDC